jgi:hypothetical protein
MTVGLLRAFAIFSAHIGEYYSFGCSSRPAQSSQEPRGYLYFYVEHYKISTVLEYVRVLFIRLF